MVNRLSTKLYSWASVIETETMEQAIKSSQMPFIWPHLALMPDAHLGKGATVGSVIPTVGAIMPAAVGVDIGCGMIAYRTSLNADVLEDPEVRRGIHAGISAAIPLSKGNYNYKLYSRRTERRAGELLEMQGSEGATEVAPEWDMQLGSLGSGNHFIEVSLDEDGRVWLFLHSGSRGVGNKLATKYTKIALDQCKRRWIPLPDPDLAYLVEGEPEFWSYMTALRWAQRFAFLNREEMMDRVIDAVETVVGGGWHIDERIQCHHNYTEQMSADLMRNWKKPEGAYGHVWLSRKGAIDASEGTRGIIPGSMATASYVVTGLGNTLALDSSPHGAGRMMSRNAARKTFTRESLDAHMAGIEWGHSDEFLDEHPEAYKNIDTVISDADDLVRVDHVLRQIINVKGD